MNDVTALGGGSQGLCDDSSQALVLQSVAMRGGDKNFVTSFIFKEGFYFKFNRRKLERYSNYVFLFLI